MCLKQRLKLEYIIVNRKYVRARATHLRTAIAAVIKNGKKRKNRPQYVSMRTVDSRGRTRIMQFGCARLIVYNTCARARVYIYFFFLATARANNTNGRPNLTQQIPIGRRENHE